MVERRTQLELRRKRIERSKVILFNAVSRHCVRIWLLLIKSRSNIWGVATLQVENKFMKTYINISNVPVEIVAEVKRIAETEFDGNESAAYRKLLREALEAREIKSKPKKERE